MSPQKKGVVPPKVEKRLTELGNLARETQAQLDAECIDAIRAGGSYREVARISGVSTMKLQNLVKAAGGLPRAEADRAYHAERRRIWDEALGPAKALLEQMERERREQG